MSDNWRPPSPSAFDTNPWPKTLLARAVDRDAGHARIHGYDVANDLAPNYRHSDVIYLAIVGELPNDQQSWLFHVAACSASTVSINEGPAHVGHLARLTSGAIASIFGAAAICAADNAMRVVAEHAALRAWLDRDALGEAPRDHHAANTDEARYVSDLISTARRYVDVPHAFADLSRRGIEVALLHRAGLSSAEHMEAALAWAMTSGAIAEALVTKPYEFNRYPAHLPPYRYVASDTEGTQA